MMAWGPSTSWSMALPISGTEVKASQDFEQLRLQSMHVCFHCSLLPRLAHNNINFLARLGNHVFDARRVDTPIEDQAGQSQASHFAPHGVEAGKNHCFGCVVNDQVNARGGFERADIATFTANDAPLHLVIR